jgi:hypothetical protein
MNTTVYPTNYDFSDDYYFSSQLFNNVDESWDFPMLSASNDTLPSQGLDVFEDIRMQEDDLPSSPSETVPSEEEVIDSTPPPSSPSYFPAYSPYSPVDQSPDHTGAQAFVKVKEECVDPMAQMRNNAWLAHYHQQLQQLMFQQKMMMSLQNPQVFTLAAPAVPNRWPDGYDMNAAAAAAETKKIAPPCGSDSIVNLTSLDTTHFGSSCVSLPKLKAIPVDISGNLSDAQYNKIFKKYHLQLQLDSHPTMTEQDLEDIKVHGRMYFLKNVKTIVPKIGPWKFNAHVSHRRTDERQYNIPGMAITCKVKEWLTDDGLWRLYHFKKGKTVKPKKLSE